MTKKIGFWGYPNPDIVDKIRKEYPNFEWIDLDISYDVPKTNILPDNYCRIIKNIIDNAIYMQNDLVKIIAQNHPARPYNRPSSAASGAF